MSHNEFSNFTQKTQDENGNKTEKNKSEKKLW